MKAQDFTISGHDTFINLWPMIEVVKKYEKPGVRLYHPQGFTETLRRIEDQIYRLKWCKDISFAHTAWCQFDFGTTNPEVLAKRIFLTQQKLARIAARYPSRRKD